jgi:hypothetical protein
LAEQPHRRSGRGPELEGGGLGGDQALLRVAARIELYDDRSAAALGPADEGDVSVVDRLDVGQRPAVAGGREAA